MPITYEPIATTTLTSNQASIDFTSIPSTYTDLILVLNGYSTTQAGIYIQLGNGTIDTGNNYSFTYIQAYLSSVSSGRTDNTSTIYCGAMPSSEGQVTIIQLNNYANTSIYKTILTGERTASRTLTSTVGLWRSTAAINCLKLYNGNYASGFTATLYGIKAA